MILPLMQKEAMEGDGCLVQAVGGNPESEMLEGSESLEGGLRIARRASLSSQEVRATEIWQGTIARSFALEGNGVHSGKAVRVVLHPAEAGAGIVLRRVDLVNGQRDIPLRYDRVEQRRLCTKVVGKAGTEVSMVEHLMCALSIARIDNLLVELDADELPILDGSAEPWLVAIDEARVVRQNEPRRYLQVCKSVEVREGDRFCRLVPLGEEGSRATLSVDFTIDFPHKKVGQQRLRLAELSSAGWREQIAAARTFAFKEDIEHLRQQNFALGGSLDNAVLVDGHGIVNREGLRYEDEFVRHKILDLCGDLYLAGLPLLAHIEACKSGHRLNNRLLHALFEDTQAWREVCLPSGDETGDERISSASL